MRYLLIDISNSYTKLQFATEEALVEERVVLKTESLSVESLQASASENVDRVVVASVVPAKNALVESAFGPALFVGPETRMSVSLEGYPKPETIGPDRLANAAALAGKYPLTGIAIDCGTAVTVDIVSSQREFLGGVIAPGFGAMSSYLNEKTALLPKVEADAEIPDFGNSTESAMTAGCIHAFRGLLREIYHRICNEKHLQPASVVLTGGDAALAKRLIPEFSCIDRDLTLEGLRLIGNMR